MSAAAPLGRWIAGRFGAAIVTLVALSVVVFGSASALPGDASGALAGSGATPSERDALRTDLGLDRPVAERYLSWVLAALHGDLGRSLVSGREITPLVAERLTDTLTVTAIAVAVIAATATGVGLASGMREGSAADRTLTALTVLTMSTPDFLTATALLALLTSLIPVLPAVALLPLGDSAWQHPEVLVLPVATLALGGAGPAARMMRAAVVDVMRAPFIEHARLNGARGVRLALVHVLPNAAAPALQSLTLVAAGLLGGGIVVETLFGLPGIGLELTRAVSARDVPTVEAVALTLGATALAIVLAGDVGAALLRRRRGAERVGG
ncbi:ABC transporter permease [Clavibacter tessellarius]|uniref:Peptide ABC transporter permease n=1 Tax=Clavibacter tessellarius TaxID=31965 RepID=A0A154V290_9MICO|nr:ABC transporter permease [Clavibacter michiganensis]KZC95304.1 peptide ABC transporter permease [Clavibacter michiganensis subsp. tessellarius]